MWRKLTWVLLLAVVLSLAFPAVSPVLAQSGNPPVKVELQESASLPWYVGVIILIAVVTGVTLFKERMSASRKKDVITVNCCAPLVEDGTSPFAPVDDEPAPKP